MGAPRASRTRGGCCSSRGGEKNVRPLGRMKRPALSSVDGRWVEGPLEGAAIEGLAAADGFVVWEADMRAGGDTSRGISFIN